ncbi:MAG TPA: hypothetical protein VFA21_11035 [Pyrinomonadaceae bacterium]|jgi:hypothetical protein|nr:hypothetical protein [Pyrinomonadaceae bacterium]
MSLAREKAKVTSGDVAGGKDLRAAEFFREVLTPAAVRERAEGREFFALRPDAEAESYFVEPTRRVTTREDFELRAAGSIEEFVGALAALWAAEGRDGLAAMAQRLGELAAEFGEGEEQREDVSPFTYVMF